MTCLLGLLALFFPRIALIFMWLGGYGAAAFQTVLWPLLGFLFMPFTTCGYAIAANEFGGLHGAGLAVVILGVILDVGSSGFGIERSRRYRRP